MYLPKLLLFTFIASPSIFGQALPTGEQPIRLQAYGMFSFVRPDSRGNVTNVGGTAGVTVNAFALGRLEPGLDLRVLGSHGRDTNEYVYSGGPRLQLDLGRLQPYGAFHAGYGKIVFTQSGDPNYTHDDSVVYALLGGVDYRISRSFSVRVEAQGQRWQFTPKDAPFHPVSASVGVRYQLHLRSKYGPE